MAGSVPLAQVTRAACEPALAACAVCGGAGFEIVERQDLDLVGLGPCGLAFGLCRQCGHIQQAPPVPPALMARHYACFSNYTAFEDGTRLRTAPPGLCTQRLLAMARDLGLKPGLAFEVGCASGKHLHYFRQAGWQVAGCDLSAKAAAQAAAIYGIAVEAEDEAACLPRQSGLDLVLLVHVLEHFYTPLATLERIHGALAEGGYLILEVPCAIAPERQPPGWFAFEHLHYFAFETLEHLLECAGFEAVELRVTLTETLGPVMVVAARKRARRNAMPSAGYAHGVADMAHRYATRNAALWTQAKARLASLEGPAFLWGAGVFGAQILDRTGLRAWIQIEAAADRDPQKWGLKLGDVPVISPQEMLARAGAAPIIVGSYFAQTEIAQSLRDAGLAAERIVTLFERSA